VSIEFRRMAGGIALGLGGFGWAFVVAWLLQMSYDTAMGVALFHLIGGVGIAITWAVASKTESAALVRIITVGWCIKVVGTLARFYVLQVVYGGDGDANRYSSVGAEVATMLRNGDMSWHRPGDGVIGTHFVEYVTGIVFAVTGPTTLGGFMVFSALGFMGTFLMYRAVRIAAPEVDPRRYALLVFLLPSLAFWPSSIGKETLMLLGIGLFTNGAARLFVRRMSGMPLVAAGVGLTALVRPHITLLLVAALLLATVVVRPVEPTGEIPLGKILKVGMAAALLVWAAAAAGSYLEVDPLDRGAVGQALETTGERTDEGESAFTNVNPVLFPVAAVTVLFRPFPWEAGNLQGGIAAVEGTFLLVLTWRRRRDLWRAIRRLRTSPLLAFALMFTLLFVYAYTGVNNFGILARQRVQVQPLVMMLLCTVVVTVRPPPTESSPDRASLPVGAVR
jgi:hypothetical protein